MKIRRFHYLIFFLLVSVIAAKGSEPETSVLHKNDFSLLHEKKISEKNHIHHHDVRFLRTRSSSFLVRYNPVSLLFGGLMYAYQGFISPQLPSECLYMESCSQFSKNLIAEYGLIKGVFTTSDRLMRCNRLSALDVHPMLVNPETGKVIESVDIYKPEP